MAKKDIFAMDRKDRADRTYQRMVYYKLSELKAAISTAKRHGADCGITGELDTRHLIEDLAKLAEIEYRTEGDRMPDNVAEIPLEIDEENTLEDEDLDL